MKMASRLIDLISKKKTNCTCSTLFLLISTKQICTCSTLFCLSLAVVLHDYNTFVRLKRQTSQLHTIFMEKLSYVLTQYFVSSVDDRFYFSLPLIFMHLAGRQHFSFSHRRFEFPCFSSNEFSITRSSSFSVIHDSVHIKNNAEKDTTFFFLIVRAAM